MNPRLHESTHKQILAALRKAMETAYQKHHESDAEAIKQEIYRLERRSA